MNDEIIIAKILGGLIVLVLGFIVVNYVFRGEVKEIPCSEYKDSIMVNVPARCINYFK